MAERYYFLVSRNVQSYTANIALEYTRCNLEVTISDKGPIQKIGCDLYSIQICFIKTAVYPLFNHLADTLRKADNTKRISVYKIPPPKALLF